MGAEHNRPAIELVVDAADTNVVARVRTHQAVARPENSAGWAGRIDKGDGACAAIPGAGSHVVFTTAQARRITVADPVIVVVTHQAVARTHDASDACEGIGKSHRAGVRRSGHAVGPVRAQDNDLIANKVEFAKPAHLITGREANQAVSRADQAGGAGNAIKPGHRALAATPVRAEHQRLIVAKVVDAAGADEVAGCPHQAVA